MVCFAVADFLTSCHDPVSTRSIRHASPVWSQVPLALPPHGMTSSPPSSQRGNRLQGPGPLGRLLRLGWALVVLVGLLGGCSGAPSIPLAEWQLESAGQPGRALTLPARFDGDLAPGVTSYSLTTSLDLPRDLEGQDLILGIPFFRGQLSLFVDGEQAILLDPAQAAAGRPRFVIPRRAGLSGETHLRLDVAYSDRSSAHFDTRPSLGNLRGGGGFPAFVAELDRTSAFFALASALLSCLLFGTVAFARRKAEGRHFGWLSVQALASMAYPAYVLGLLPSPLGIDASLFMLCAVATAAVVGIRFVHAELRFGPVSRFWEIALGVVWALAVVAGELDTVAPVAGALVALAITYQLARSAAVAWRTRSAVAAALAACWLSMSVFGTTDVFAWLGLGELAGGLRTGCLGMSLAAFAQSVVLTAHYVRSVREADTLNAELARRLDALESNAREITLLDKELRHQVAARAEGFAKVLARLGTTPAGAPDAPELPDGFVLESRYRLAHTLGMGGMGRVYEATRLEDGQAVAVKVLTSTRVGPDLARLAREAELAGKIRHPHVVRVLDVDVAKSGFFYIVMELVRGVSLRAERPRWGELPWALGVLAQLADGLAAIHAAGVIHRDLKPANVLLEGPAGSQPQVRIADFGVSALVGPETPESPSGSRVRRTIGNDEPTRAVRPNVPAFGVEEDAAEGESEGDTHLTRAGIVLGTPRYVAPEVVRKGARAALPASDVFAFGVIAHELLTGEPPYAEQAIQKLFRGQDYPPPPSLATKVPTLSRELALLLEACLAWAPEERPTAAALRSALALPLPLSA